MDNEENVVEVAEKPKLLGMIMNPVDQFNKMRERPVIWVPLIIVTILTIVGLLMMANSMDFSSQSGMEEMDIPAEEMALFETIAMVSFIVVGVFTPIIAILISTLIYLVVAKIAKSDVMFKQLFSMNTYVYLITVLGMLVNGLAFMLVGSVDSEVSFTSLNSVVQAEGALGALFNMIEVFTIWSIILHAIGLQIVAKLSKGLSWGVVIAIFLIMASFSMITVGLSSLMGV